MSFLFTTPLSIYKSLQSFYPNKKSILFITNVDPTFENQSQKFWVAFIVLLVPIVLFLVIKKFEWTKNKPLFSNRRHLNILEALIPIITQKLVENIDLMLAHHKNLWQRGKKTVRMSNLDQGDVKVEESDEEVSGSEVEL